MYNGIGKLLEILDVALTCRPSLLNQFYRGNAAVFFSQSSFLN